MTILEADKKGYFKNYQGNIMLNQESGYGFFYTEQFKFNIKNKPELGFVKNLNTTRIETYEDFLIKFKEITGEEFTP